MSDLKKYDTAEIRRVAQEFTRSGQQTSDILTSVSNLVQNLEGSFQGVAARHFFDHFHEQTGELRKSVQLYEDIGTELNTLASRIESFDQSLLS